MRIKRSKGVDRQLKLFPFTFTTLHRGFTVVQTEKQMVFKTPSGKVRSQRNKKKIQWAGTTVKGKQETKMGKNKEVVNGHKMWVLVLVLNCKLAERSGLGVSVEWSLRWIAVRGTFEATNRREFSTG